MPSMHTLSRDAGRKTQTLRKKLAFYKGMFSASKNYVAFYTVQGHGIHCRIILPGKTLHVSLENRLSIRHAPHKGKMTDTPSGCFARRQKSESGQKCGA